MSTRIRSYESQRGYDLGTESTKSMTTRLGCTREVTEDLITERLLGTKRPSLLFTLKTLWIHILNRSSSHGPSVGRTQKRCLQSHPITVFDLGDWSLSKVIGIFREG